MPTVGEELWLYYSQLRLPCLVARLTFPTRNPLFYTKDNVGTMSFGTLDDVTTFQIGITTRIDDVTQHNHGNHGRLLSGRFIVNPNS